MNAISGDQPCERMEKWYLTGPFPVLFRVFVVVTTRTRLTEVAENLNLAVS